MKMKTVTALDSEFDGIQEFILLPFNPEGELNDIIHSMHESINTIKHMCDDSELINIIVENWAISGMVETHLEKDNAQLRDDLKNKINDYEATIEELEESFYKSERLQEKKIHELELQ